MSSKRSHRRGKDKDFSAVDFSVSRVEPELTDGLQGGQAFFDGAAKRLGHLQRSVIRVFDLKG